MRPLISRLRAKSRGQLVILAKVKQKGPVRPSRAEKAALIIAHLNVHSSSHIQNQCRFFGPPGANISSFAVSHLPLPLAAFYVRLDILFVNFMIPYVLYWCHSDFPEPHNKLISGEFGFWKVGILAALN